MPRDGAGVFTYPVGSNSTAGTLADATKVEAKFSDLLADLNAPRPVTAGGTGATSISGIKAALDLEIGVDVQAYSAALASLAGLTTAANKMVYTTGANTYAVTDLSAFARTILDDADAAAARTTLGVAIGTNVQAYDASLSSLAGLSLVAGDILYATGADTLARLAKGTAGQQLRMNSGATAPEWAAGGATLLGTLTTTSGTTQTLSGLTLTGYKFLMITATEVSHNSGTNQALLIDGLGLSSGATQHTTLLSGVAWLDLATGAFGSPGGSQKTSITTASTSISFTWASGAAFDAGSIRIYGVA